MTSSSSFVDSPAGATRAAPTILLSGLVAAVLDISWAIGQTLMHGGNPLAMFRFIAGGVLGADALKGGFGTAMFGLGLHFVIAFGAATVFYGLSRQISFLVQRPVLAGLCYGVAVWLVMNLVLLRLSAWHATQFPPKGWPTALLAVVLCVGLPIALITSHLSRSAARRVSEA